MIDTSAISNLDPDKLAALSESWSPESRAAMVEYLAAAKRREEIRKRYSNVIDLAKAVDPNYVETPALTLIGEKIEIALNRRRCNLLINVPPQEGKSTTAAVYTPLRALQINPNWRIILATYAESLAHDHSRAIREIITRHGSNVIDPLTGVEIEDKLGFQLSSTSNKVDTWRVDNGRGGLVAAGLHGSLTGRAADLFIIDDPYKDMEEADSESQREKVNNWMRSVARTRLAPNASIILIQCMTGDTPVLRPDGSETPLRDIRPGDEIATYEAGKLTTATVLAFKPQGPDHIKLIRTRSGRTVRANARHPFLTIQNGVESWVRVRNLRLGMCLTSIASGSVPAPTIPNTALRSVRASARIATTESDGRTDTGHPRELSETDISNIGMGSPLTTTSAFSPSRVASAGAVASRLPSSTCRSTGMESSASTMTMTLERFEDCSATTAISCSRDLTQPDTFNRDSPIWFADEIIEIVDAGVEDVFDIQVDRTENFIANRTVAHNTRWHPDDLAGEILAKEKLLAPKYRTWHHVNIPAVAEEGLKDSLGREPGTAMVSARGDRDWSAIRRDVGERVWYALYQGSPRNPAGGLFLKTWFEEHMEVPEHPVAAIVGIDPADTGKDDETGIIGAYLCPTGQILLAEDWSGQFTSDQWARQAVLMALTMGAREIAMEAYTAADTYVTMLKRAWADIHREALKKRMSGAELTRVERRSLAEDMPFTIYKWRGRANSDSVARASLMRQGFETKKARTVAHKLTVFENQAADWQAGQHCPDRVSAAVVVHDRLVKLGSGRLRAAPPVNRPASAGTSGGRGASVTSLQLRRRLG